MPTLQEGSTGAVVNSLQTLLTNGAPGQWNTTPQGIDGNFGPHTKASVVAFQAWGGVAQDGVVGDQTWAVSLHAASATLKQRWAYSSWSVDPTQRTRLDACAGHTHAFGVGFDFISRRVEAALGRRPSSRHDTSGSFSIICTSLSDRPSVD